MKRLLFLLLMICFTTNCANATKIPLKITPAEVITTAHDEVENGDKLLFKLVSDTRLGDKVIFEAGSMLVAYVDYVTDNGFGYDSANIWCRKVWIKKNDNNYTKSYDTDFSINGFSLLKGLYPKTRRFFEYVGLILSTRGKEINFDPSRDKCVITVWIDY